jgi:hypothetical protein
LRPAALPCHRCQKPHSNKITGSTTTVVFANNASTKETSEIVSQNVAGFRLGGWSPEPVASGYNAAD